MKNQEIIKATANKSRRTFTLRVYFKGKLVSKYRTNPLSPDEFRNEMNNTTNDWRQFLKSDDYYVLS